MRSKYPSGTHPQHVTGFLGGGELLWGESTGAPGSPSSDTIPFPWFSDTIPPTSLRSKREDTPAKMTKCEGTSPHKEARL